MDSSFDIPDSTDWLPTPLASLARIEASLRCQVCKDFFNTPMITSCSHTFCSVCIRRCLSNDGKCPACRTGEQAIRLRTNGAVQDIVDAFKAGRERMLQFAKDASIPTKTDGKTTAKRKLEETELEEQEGGRNVQVRRTRSQSRKAVSLPLEEDDVVEDNDEEFEPDDGLVACPVCSRRMKEQEVFLHLDNCTGESTAKSSTPRALPLQQNGPSAFPPPRSSNPSPPPIRLPTISYDLLKETALRKKLRELGIPDWGSKSLLVRRHTEYLNLHNANCDSPRPKTKREVLQELDVWERTQGGNAAMNGSGSAVNGVTKKEFDPEAWSRGHDDDFKKLIADARRNRKGPTTTKAGFRKQVINMSDGAAADGFPIDEETRNGSLKSRVGEREETTNVSEEAVDATFEGTTRKTFPDEIMDSQESSDSTEAVHRNDTGVVDLTYPGKEGPVDGNAKGDMGRRAPMFASLGGD